MTLTHTDTIVAQATPPGRGGVGIVRVSGPFATKVAKQILKVPLQPRQAKYTAFFGSENDVIDQGIALYFKAPNSFTGEDVIEFQGHGGPVIMDILLESILAVPEVRLARPGEFSEQAFLNDKLDLAQAEAIADLIDASSTQAAKSALRSLQGEFSNSIHKLNESIIQLRMYVEAAIDFPEEEIDFLSDGKVANDLAVIIAESHQLRDKTKQGALLREGMQVVIAGKPNAGKSSLMNALAGKQSAIVTDVAGTTRDILKEQININGMPLHIVDTAGLRNSPDKVEQIGIERAWEAIKQADRVLFVVDSTTSNSFDPHTIWPEFMQKLPPTLPITVVRNKADKTGDKILQHHVKSEFGTTYAAISLSANTGEGIDLLRRHLAESVGLNTTTEGQFIARRRHLDAIDNAMQHLDTGHLHLHETRAGELLAEELRLAHQSLSTITGEFTSDDLLGRIFSSFCIGK